MPNRSLLRGLGGLALAFSFVSIGLGYIHFPPMTLKKMCKDSHHIRVLKIEKANKEKGVILFQIAEALKGGESQFTSFKHVIRADTEGAKPVLDWIGKGKSAVMFYIEGSERGLGYVFIDRYCYSVDYNIKEKHWLVIRGEPNMSACYHGSVDTLQRAIKDTLSGKEIKVPTREPDKKEDKVKRDKVVNEVLIKNRS